MKIGAQMLTLRESFYDKFNLMLKRFTPLEPFEAVGLSIRNLRAIGL